MTATKGAERAVPAVPPRAGDVAEQSWFVPLSDVEVDGEIEAAVLAVIRSGW